MQLSLLPVVSLLVSLAAAQSSSSVLTTGTSTACAAADVFNSCLVIENGYLAACSPTDYACQCQKAADVLNCYQQCPNNPGMTAASNAKIQNCNNASVYGQTLTAVSSPVSASGVAATTTGGSGAQVTSSGAVKAGSGTSSGAVATASGKSNAAGNLAAGAGGVMMGLAGVIAAVL